jgi:hypothetical protein
LHSKSSHIFKVDRALDQNIKEIQYTGGIYVEQKNGFDSVQNYDVIVKWISEALRGYTLDVIGVKSAPIEEVFGFEPAEITVTSGRLDIMLRDEAGVLFHME